MANNYVLKIGQNYKKICYTLTYEFASLLAEIVDVLVNRSRSFSDLTGFCEFLNLIGQTNRKEGLLLQALQDRPANVARYVDDPNTTYKGQKIRSYVFFFFVPWTPGNNHLS